MGWGQQFLDPHSKINFFTQHKAHMRELVNYLQIDVAQVYRLYMIWELALNAAMGMKRMILLLSWLISVD